MKKVILTLAVSLMAITLMQSCNNNPNSSGMNTGADTTKDVAMSTDAKMTTDTATMQSANTNNGGMAKTDNDFVTKAAGGGMMEVELVKLPRQMPPART